MLALLMGLAAGGASFEVPPRPLAWEALDREAFDRAWILPERARAGRDLLAELRELVALAGEDADGAPLCFGDLVREASERSAGARRLWLARRLRGAPPALAARADDVRALLLDDELFADDWSPARDTPADGLLLAEPWVLGAADGAPWNGLDVTPRLEQGATLVRAELSAIKAVENDYRTYPAHTGADYEFIRPLADRYRRGTDAAGRPFSTLAIEFRCNLPFPFTHYDCELRILNRWAADGTARTDIYSTSDDFHWLAGRDVFLPVRDSAGARVAWLLVRHFGFDLDGVPDESKHRAEALRSSLGNLRRKAEAFAGAADDAALGDRALTDFAVLGARE